MLYLTCPNCGPRNASEFRHGGEAHARPAVPESLDERDWVDFLYMKHNTAGQQTEWWYHASGCGLWFLADRHNSTNDVIRTYRWQPKTTPPASPQSSQQASPRVNTGDANEIP